MTIALQNDIVAQVKNTEDPVTERMDIEHGEVFKTGTRLLLLKSRHKDGYVGKERAILRQSNSVDSFDTNLDELRTLMRPSERIYASAAPRDLKKAGRIFATRLLNSMFDPPEVRDDFYRRLPFHWYSSLMQPEAAARESQLWMWDCDTEDDYISVCTALNDLRLVPYTYATKTGRHVLVKPFNRDLLPATCPKSVDKNPLILWSYA